MSQDLDLNLCLTLQLKLTKMIQRIQSIFLLLVAGAFFSLFGLELASSNAATTGFLSDTVFNIQDHPVLLVMTILGGALAVLNIFMFKNRTLQMRFGYLLILLSVLLPLLGFLLFYQEWSTIPKGTLVKVGFGLLAPLAALIFSALANRFIKKDEQLIKSMDRLR